MHWGGPFFDFRCRFPNNREQRDNLRQYLSRLLLLFIIYAGFNVFVFFF